MGRPLLALFIKKKKTAQLEMIIQVMLVHYAKYNGYKYYESLFLLSLL